MFSFSPETKYESPNSLIPAGTLSFAKAKVRGIKSSNETQGRYGDVELILAGRHENRRVFTVVMDPSDQRNSEKARQMGMVAIQHIAEASGLFNPQQPESYGRFAGKSFQEVLMAIDGQRVAIKVGVEKGSNGHQDKNRVGDWLSPNPNSSTSKQWNKLIAGDVDGEVQAPKPQTQAAQDAGFGGAFAQAAPAQAEPAGVVSGQAPNWL